MKKNQLVILITVLAYGTNFGQTYEAGFINIDLKPYNIILNEDVIVTLEWVENKGENHKGEGIFFPLSLLSNGTIYKHSSQAKFKKFSNMGVAFNLDVRY